MPLSARLRAGARSAWRQAYASSSRIRTSAGERLFKSNIEQHPENICSPSIRCFAADDSRLYQNARQGFSRRSIGLASRGQLSIQMKPGGFFEQKSSFTSSASVLSKADIDKQKKETISVSFVLKDGEKKTIHVPVGMSMMEAAHENDIELEGACEGSLACSTCHVIIKDEKFYQKLPEPTDEENDMLDLAFGLTETSRLGCQVIADPGLDGMEVALPPATRNFAVDGHVPKPH